VSPRLASTFAILPAIDLRDGRVVRLRQGDFAREQVYADDPLGVAAAFASAGAEWIHIVDLDGARAGERRQTEAIGAIVTASTGRAPRYQVAGGLRTQEAVADVLATGVDRVVIGTAALRDPEFVERALALHGPARIAIALDVRDELAVGDGWVSGAPGLPVAEVVAQLGGLGVETFAVTAIERDGLLGGPDLSLLARVIEATDAAVLASGGIRSVADLEAVRQIGCAGAIVGRAIYDGSLDLRSAIQSMTTA
jgi:phosphoribosylformimino-5-aminoimidazole carboxamide ribotide isomerase